MMLHSVNVHLQQLIVRILGLLFSDEDPHTMDIPARPGTTNRCTFSADLLVLSDVFKLI